eukprot:gene3150-biopygen3274
MHATSEPVHSVSNGIGPAPAPVRHCLAMAVGAFQSPAAPAADHPERLSPEPSRAAVSMGSPAAPPQTPSAMEAPPQPKRVRSASPGVAHSHAWQPACSYGFDTYSPVASSWALAAGPATVLHCQYLCRWKLGPVVLLPAPVPNGPRCAICLHKNNTGLRMPRVLPCGNILCHGCIMQATAEERFECPYCKEGTHSPCTPGQRIPTTQGAERHARAPLDQAMPPTMCPEHQKPVAAVCEDDGALLCASCLTKVGSRHYGRQATSVEDSSKQLEQLLGTLLEGLRARCSATVTAAVEWPGQAAVAEFLSEAQCALVEAEGEKTKMLVDSATALACQQMRDSVASLKEERLRALGQISVASAEATVLAGKAGKALQTKCTGNLVACLSAVRLAEASPLALMKPTPPVTNSILMLHYDATRSSIVQQPVHVRSCDCFSKRTIISGGWKHCVALKGDGSIICWGDGKWQQCSGAPAGTDFVSVSAATGGSLSVALRSDGSLHSWGDDGHGQCTGTPSGTGFVAVSAGAGFGVATRSPDGTLAAWGDDEFKHISDLPSGNDFVEVAAGHSFAGVPLQLCVPPQLFAPATALPLSCPEGGWLLGGLGEQL